MLYEADNVFIGICYLIGFFLSLSMNPLFSCELTCLTISYLYFSLIAYTVAQFYLEILLTSSPLSSDWSFIISNNVFWNFGSKSIDAYSLTVEDWGSDSF